MSSSSQESSCPVCGGTAVRTDEMHIEAETRYTLHTCSVCHVQYWMPFKNPGASWYEHDARYADRNQSPILTPNKKQTDVITFLSKKQGALLDVGCGVGNFLAYATKHGWSGWGIDFDRDAIAAGKDTFGLEHLDVASLSEFRQMHPEQRFDLITFFDVLEHLDNHREFMGEIKAILSPGGAIGLSVPYRHGWRWLLQNDVPPRHLTRWNEESLQHFLEHHGFSVVFLRRLPVSLQHLILKLRFRYGKWLSFGMVGRARAKDKTGSGPSDSHRLSLKVRVLHVAAKIKDAMLFGVPALFLWVFLLFSKRRYTDMYVVAERAQ